MSILGHCITAPARYLTGLANAKGIFNDCDEELPGVSWRRIAFSQKHLIIKELSA